MRALINKHPKLVFLLVGLAVGATVSLFTVVRSDKMISRMETQLERSTEIHREYVNKTTHTIESLKQENRKLKSKTSTYKIIKPDGTVEERTVSETESEESITTEVKEKFEQELTERLEKMERESQKRFEEIISSNKKLNISAGYNTEFDYYIGGSYAISTPFTMNAWGTRGGTFAVGVGVSL